MIGPSGFPKTSTCNLSQTARKSDRMNELKRLRADNARLREALEELLSAPTGHDHKSWELREAAKEKASAALSAPAKEGTPRWTEPHQALEEIRGDATDRELTDRLCEVQGFLRHGAKEGANE
jgi:hypothetical protein